MACTCSQSSILLTRRISSTNQHLRRVQLKPVIVLFALVINCEQVIRDVGAMTSQRGLIYVNPQPSTISSSVNPGVKLFHESFPGYKPSPLVCLPEVASELGVQGVYLKQESNRFSLPSFKVLGASWAIYRAILSTLGLPDSTSLEQLISITSSDRGITLVAATEGNHGRAVAYVGRLLSLRVHIFVPKTMDDFTKQRIASEGAEVHVVEGDYDFAVQKAASAADEIDRRILIQDTAFEGYEKIPALIVEGYSTILLEADAQLQALGVRNSVTVSPVGVGSFAQAVTTHYKSRTPPATMVTVEPDTGACLNNSLRTGRSVSITTTPSIMAGMNCGTVSTAAWPVLQSLVDVSVTVSDSEAHSAVQYLTSKSVDSGPCGAATLAAIRHLSKEGISSQFFTPDSVVLLLSTEGQRPYDVPEEVA